MPGGWTALRSGSLYGLVFAQARCFTSVSRGVAVGRPAVVRMYEKIAILQLPSRIGSAARGRRDTDSANTKHELTAPAPRPPHSPISICGACQVGLGSQAAVLCVDSYLDACEYGRIAPFAARMFRL